MRALSIAATGMNAQQTNLDVIANNIANINTTGFKRARASSPISSTNQSGQKAFLRGPIRISFPKAVMSVWVSALQPFAASTLKAH